MPVALSVFRPKEVAAAPMMPEVDVGMSAVANSTPSSAIRSVLSSTMADSICT